jgi:hypothetical protein
MRRRPRDPPYLSSLPRHQAAIKGAGRCPFPFFAPSLFHPRPMHLPHPPHHRRRPPLLLSPRAALPQWNQAKALSSSPPPVSFAFCTPLSLLLHGGWCRPLRALHRRQTPPRHAAPPLHRRATISGESTPCLLGRWLALLTVTLPLKTLPCLDLRSDGASYAKVPPRARPGTAWAGLPGGPSRASRPVRPRSVGHHA